MIKFDKFTLENGLRVIVHEDQSTPMAIVNVMYDVGARDENPEKTGFAHLFEHLMFGGSVNVDD
ncbi:MAG: insulinase family protein, partial [Flavitalea sp.]